MTPRLSILIPSIPSRWYMAKVLFDGLTELVGDRDIEVLLLMDNKQRTIGEKREALKNASNGKYFMFVDDDDSLYSVDEIYEATANDVDVITFKSKCRNSDGSEYIVTFGLKNEIEHNTQDGRYLDCKRPPFTQCAWASRFKKFAFPASNYGEDWEWVKQCLPTAFLETHIPLVLHGYNFDPEVSEAVVTYPITGIPEQSFEPKQGVDDIYNKSVDFLRSFTNTPPPRRCIVNLATSQYWKGQLRLQNSVYKYDGIDFICFSNEAQVEAPPHDKNPYAFKIYTIDHARAMGYDQILWLDASVYSVKDPTPVFDWLTKHGIFMEEAGHWAGTWSPSYVLKYFGITKEQAMQMPMFSAGYVGFDFRHPRSIEFFAEWKEAMLNGMFMGNWSESRHDMSAGSIIANKMGLNKLYSPGGQFFSYIGPGFGQPSETAVFHLAGMP